MAEEEPAIKTAQKHSERSNVRNAETDNGNAHDANPEEYQKQIEEGILSKTLVQQAVFAHRLGDRELLGAILRHSFSNGAQHQEGDGENLPPPSETNSSRTDPSPSSS